MEASEIVTKVQALGQTQSPEQANRAIQATLETLAERILGDEANHLAAQLPAPMAEYLKGRAGENGEPFSLKEFYRRVSEREGIDPTQAAIHSRAVVTVLNAAVTTGEFEDVKTNLPREYEDLFAPNPI
jgi:uncharacterized protein (DUF2267 family)